MSYKLTNDHGSDKAGTIISDAQATAYHATPSMIAANQKTNGLQPDPTPASNTASNPASNPATTVSSAPGSGNNKYMDVLQNYYNQVMNYASMRTPITPTKSPTIPVGPNEGGLAIAGHLMDLATNFLSGYDKAVQIRQQAAQRGLENMGRMASFNMMRPGQQLTLQNREYNSLEPQIDAINNRLALAQQGLVAGSAAKRAIEEKSTQAVTDPKTGITTYTDTNGKPISTQSSDATLMAGLQQYYKSQAPQDQGITINALGKGLSVPDAAVVEKYLSGASGTDVSLTPEQRLNAMNTLRSLTAADIQKSDALFASTKAKLDAQNAEGYMYTDPNLVIPQAKFDVYNSYKQAFAALPTLAPVSTAPAITAPLQNYPDNRTPYEKSIGVQYLNNKSDTLFDKNGNNYRAVTDTPVVQAPVVQAPIVQAPVVQAPTPTN